VTPLSLRYLLICSLTAACRPGGRGSHAEPTMTRPVAWASPGASPQLQSYLSAWPSATMLPGRCGYGPSAIDADSIGPLHVGQRLSAVLAQCHDPVIGWDWGDEGIPEPALMVRIGPGIVLVTLTDTTDSARIQYLSTADSAFRTSEGVRVGMPVEELPSRIGPLTFLEGECGLFAGSVRHPELGVQLTLPSGATECGELVPTPPGLLHGAVVAKLFLHRAT
jgi:hypothetical protein